MNTTVKNMLVGLFALLSLILVVGLILFLKPTVGDGKQTYYVRFSDIGSIGIGTRVLFAGKPVGEVVSFREIENAREEPTDQLGRVYFYELTLRIDSSVTVYNTDEFSIQTTGLLGEKSIGITPKAAPQGVTPVVITSQPVYADAVDILQNALIDFSELAANMEETVQQVCSWMKDHGESVASAIRATGGAMAAVDQALHQLDEGHTFVNLGVTMESLKGVSRNLDTLSQDLVDGNGTLGTLMTDKNLYLQMNAVMTKANSLMNDVNHYGVLFHLNKEWQRARIQKMAQLNTLKSPQSFRSYFEQEVDDINASMSRLSILIDKAGQSPQKEQILRSKEFQQDFAELLRKADDLSEHLRLYNQQLHEAEGN